MTHHHLSKKCFWTATVALLLPGCLGEPGAEDEPLGEESQAFEIEPAHGYEVGHSVDGVRWGNPLPTSDDYIGCSHMDNGVVRGWQLSEANVNDFRWSELLCREMASDGTQSAISDTNQHFWHAGSGTIGVSFAPSTKLAVGVRIRFTSHPFTSPIWTLKDVAILYDEADDIYAEFTGSDQAAWAFDRGGYSDELRCDPGTLLTGISVSHVDGGRNREEIGGLEVHCSELDRVLLPLPF